MVVHKFYVSFLRNVLPVVGHFFKKKKISELAEKRKKKIMFV